MCGIGRKGVMKRGVDGNKMLERDKIGVSASVQG